jgi:hypothetical protein
LKFKEEQEEREKIIQIILEKQKQKQEKAERINVKSFDEDIQSALTDKALS